MMKVINPRDLMAEAEELRKKWHAALIDYEAAKEKGRPAAEIANLDAARKQLKGAYLSKAKAAVDAKLAEHSRPSSPAARVGPWE
jgi:hypothetical protein